MGSEPWMERGGLRVSPEPLVVVGLAVLIERLGTEPFDAPKRYFETTRPRPCRRVLITQRRDGTPKAGAWEFPGGKVGPGETPEACVRREVAEELGIAVTPTESLGVFAHRYSHARVELHPWLCEMDHAQVPRPVDVADCRWISPHELPVPGFLEGNHEVVAALLKRLEQRD